MLRKLDFSAYEFASVIEFPRDVEVLDLSEGQRDLPPEAHFSKSLYTIGRYAERRPGMYRGEHYEKEKRDIHMGIDLGAPEGTPVFSFWEGKIYSFADHAKPFDYGPTLITTHFLAGDWIWALWGHLSRDSLQGIFPGRSLQRGEQIATIGNPKENGGWPPHLHFQLSLVAPKGADLPGVVSSEDFPEASRIYPDPQIVLGKLY